MHPPAMLTLRPALLTWMDVVFALLVCITEQAAHVECAFVIS
jgi:hypothetical protein